MIAEPRRVLVLGATGTIGRATVRALLAAGDEPVCLARASSAAVLPEDAIVRLGDPTEAVSIARDGIRDERFDALISCMASRTGVPEDAWAIDYRAQCAALEAARAAGIVHFVLLSAMCVQKPMLTFQQAKLQFESALIASGIRYSIVRPTAFFKSLSGQFDRVRRGKPYLLFGDGRLTACTPISDDDLARYLVGCLDDPQRWDRVLPIGGPGPALTPRAQGEALFAAMGRQPRFRRVPVALLDTIVALLGSLGHILPSLAAKAELARIGRYYATESMLVLNPKTGQYDAAATPATGGETLADHFAGLARGETAPDRGDHAVF